MEKQQNTIEEVQDSKLLEQISVVLSEMDIDYNKTLESIYNQKQQQILPFSNTLTGLPSQISSKFLYNFWLPISLMTFYKQKKIQRPFIQGIFGFQGVGKTTFSHILQKILQQFNLNVVAVSIDDFYKTYQERQLIKQEYPSFKYRGPPGTHDVQTAIDLLQNVKNQGQQVIEIPRFDKSLWNGEGDRVQPEQIQNKVDILILEGWFTGFSPVQEQIFSQEKLPYPLESEEDRQFAIQCNRNLQEYVKLWNLLDDLIILEPEDISFSKEWRNDAEVKMKQSGKNGMDQKSIHQFVEYFWKALNPQIFSDKLTNTQEQQYDKTVVTLNQKHYPVNFKYIHKI